MDLSEAYKKLNVLLSRALDEAAESDAIRTLIWEPSISDALDRERYTRDMYQFYCMSRHWRSIRKGLLRRVGWNCECCFSASYAVVHHFSYERMGKEAFDDVAVLCTDCHRRAHVSKEHNGDVERVVAASRQARGIEKTFLPWQRPKRPGAPG